MIYKQKDHAGRERIVVSKYWPDRKRFRRRVPNQTIAKNLLARIEGAIATGTWLELRKALTETPERLVTVEDFAEIYMTEYCEIRNLRPEFKRFNIDPIKRILGDVPIKEFKRSHAARFENERSKECKGATVNRGLAVLKNLLTFAMTKGIIQVHPLNRYPLLPEPETVLRVMTLEEERKLVHAIMAEDHTVGIFTAFLGETGLRLQEGLRLKWEFINIGDRMVSVEASKNYRGRHVPLSDYAMELLQQLTRVLGSPYVFTRLDTMDRWQQPRGPLERARAKVELEWVGFHSFRHFRASQWVSRGVDLRTVQELLGHRDINTTMRYAHFAPKHAMKCIVEAQRLEVLDLAASTEAAGNI